MEPKEYKELLLKYYTKNNSNIEKWIFISSTGAITLLLGFSDKITNLFIYFLYGLSIILFILTIILQLISARISKEGCDLGLDESKTEESQDCFTKSENINTVFFWTFIFAVIFSVITVFVNNYPTNKIEEKTKNINIEQQLKIEKLEYYNKQGG